MIKQILTLIVIVYSQVILAQNCNSYKLQGDTMRYESCLKCEEAYRFYQFTSEFQTIMDEAISIDSTFYVPYKAKSVAYLKSGDFINWKLLIDKAVEYDEVAVLGYRASCSYQFFRDYKGCIADIEHLDSLVTYDIGEIHNGDYHLNVIRAISYDALGETNRAIEIMKEHMANDNFYALLYDHLLLGYFYLKQEKFKEAENCFLKQQESNNLAENQYWLAQTYMRMDNQEAAKRCALSAKTKYLAQDCMFEVYTEPYAKVYLTEINNLLRSLD